MATERRMWAKEQSYARTEGVQGREGRSPVGLQHMGQEMCG